MNPGSPIDRPYRLEGTNTGKYRAFTPSRELS